MNPKIKANLLRVVSEEKITPEISAMFSRYEAFCQAVGVPITNDAVPLLLAMVGVACPAPAAAPAAKAPAKEKGK